ncbi:hypothetical protein H5410_054391 [Solanum commersonii]|uniref:Uncharacterized protein n=1 Tax=Solanum commersonii TaxID=4109 RepID=A0A9J5WET6_SOLCO|nr:hypothetical protein H5410_054391 [Solanum commersonii]
MAIIILDRWPRHLIPLCDDGMSPMTRKFALSTIHNIVLILLNFSEFGVSLLYKDEEEATCSKKRFKLGRVLGFGHREEEATHVVGSSQNLVCRCVNWAGNSG